MVGLCYISRSTQKLGMGSCPQNQTIERSRIEVYTRNQEGSNVTIHRFTQEKWRTAQRNAAENEQHTRAREMQAEYGGEGEEGVGE